VDRECHPEFRLEAKGREVKVDLEVNLAREVKAGQLDRQGKVSVPKDRRDSRPNPPKKIKNR